MIPTSAERPSPFESAVLNLVHPLDSFHGTQFEGPYGKNPTLWSSTHSCHDRGAQNGEFIFGFPLNRQEDGTLSFQMDQRGVFLLGFPFNHLQDGTLKRIETRPMVLPSADAIYFGFRQVLVLSPKEQTVPPSADVAAVCSTLGCETGSERGGVPFATGVV